MNSTLFPGLKLIPNWNQTERISSWRASEEFVKGAKSINHFPIKDQYIYFVMKANCVELRVKSVVFEFSHVAYAKLSKVINHNTTLEELLRLVYEVKSRQTFEEEF